MSWLLGVILGVNLTLMIQGYQLSGHIDLVTAGGCAALWLGGMLYE